LDAATLQVFAASLGRCTSEPLFLDRFYESFLASSPRVREKFAHTDFEKQKATLKASLSLMLLAARQEGQGPPEFLDGLAQRHGASQLAVGAELYDLWLDSLLETVRVSDPHWNPGVAEAWEQVLAVGIAYLCHRYNC
jgi:hemoglobin-like flavoprotein